MEVVSLPDGTLSPKMTSQSASPISEPPNHTFMMAGMCSFSHDKTVGRPAKLSNTTGLPIFASSARSSCCTSGISRLVRLAHSPLISAVSPMTHTITSASFAICSASFFIFTSSPQAIDLPNSPFSWSSWLRQILLPCAYSKVALPSSAFSMASLIVVYFSGAWATLHVPAILLRVSARGPISAIFPCFFRGRRFPSFFRSTKVSAATSRAICRFSAE